MPDNQVEKIHDILVSFKTGMLVTRSQDQDLLHSRPMAIARVEPNCDLWFFTARTSAKVHEIENEEHVLVALQDEGSRYLSLNGTAELVSDRAKMRDLWKDSYQTWFPQGLDDPNLLLILIHSQQAEYWDNKTGNGFKCTLQAANP
jgi:general stress protein 26